MSDPEDVVSPFVEDAELDAEASVRPRRLADFIAQHRVRDQLELLLKGAMGRGTPPDHIRSEERRVGKECSSPCRSRWSPYH